MADKKEIIESAIRFFKKQGYAATSVQDIATDCRISKGSFYKLFSSKKDLYFDVLEYLQESLLEKHLLIEASSSSPKEKLIEKTKENIESMFSNRKVFLIILDVLPAEELYQLTEEINQHKMRMYQIHKENLLTVYKSDEKTWDLVFIYAGLINEYVDLMSFNESAINSKGCATVIISCLDSYLDNSAALSPLLTKEAMISFESIKLQDKEFSKTELIEASMRKVKKLVRELPFSEDEESLFMLNVDLLQEELESEHPRSHLISSLRYFLSQKEELKRAIELMLDLYSQMERGTYDESKTDK